MNMLNLGISIQNIINYNKVQDKIILIQNDYNQYKNEITIINENFMSTIISNNLKIRNRIDQIKHLLKQYWIYMSAYHKKSIQIYSSTWFPINIINYNVNDLEEKINVINEIIKNEIKICNKKIFKNRLRIRNRAYSL